MATPKGMPEYAKGTQQAIAASTPTIDLFKKAQQETAASNAQQKTAILNQIAKQNVPSTSVSPPPTSFSSGASLGEIAKQGQTNKLAQATQGVYGTVPPPVDKPLPVMMGEYAKPGKDAGVLNEITSSVYGQVQPKQYATPSTEKPLAAYMGEAAKDGGKSDTSVLADMIKATYGQVQPTVSPLTQQPQQQVTEKSPQQLIAEESKRLADEEIARRQQQQIQQPQLEQKKPAIADEYIVGQRARQRKALLENDFQTLEALERDAQQRGYTLLSPEEVRQINEQKTAQVQQGMQQQKSVTEPQTSTVTTEKKEATTGGGVTTEPAATYQPTGEGLPTEEANKLQESAFARATEQVDRQIALQNAELDRQIQQAQSNRDYQTAQNLQAFKSAMNQMRDNEFLQARQIQQQMAGRGLLTSGMATDAQVRLQMSMNQNMRDLAQKQQIASDKLAQDFQTRLDSINEKKAKLQSGRESDIEKVEKSMLKEIDGMNKINFDLQKLQVQENKNLMDNARTVLDRLAKQGYNTAPFETVALTGNVDALAQAMANSGQPQLSLLGKDMQATIEETKSKILLTDMRRKGTLSDIDKQRSDITGFVYQNGVPLKDANGNFIPTFEARTEADKLKQKQQEIIIRQKQAATAKSKAESKTPTQIKAMTPAQQLNFIQDAVSGLLTDQFTQQGIDPDTGLPIMVRTGRKYLTKQDEPAFTDIMKNLWSSGAVSNNIIANQYRAFGLTPPKWADYPYGSVEQKDASTVDAFNKIKQQ